jgi:hypothetical protein
VTDEELEQFRQYVLDHSVMCQYDWGKAQDVLEDLVNFVNAMLAKREPAKEPLMNDRELIELAAIAYGWDKCRPFSDSFQVSNNDDPENWIEWNPLTGSSDALLLAVRLRINLKNYPEHVVASITDGPQAIEYFYDRSPDENDATRRAITRAAAEIGKTMKGAV